MGIELPGQLIKNFQDSKIFHAKTFWLKCIIICAKKQKIIFVEWSNLDLDFQSVFFPSVFLRSVIVLVFVLVG